MANDTSKYEIYLGFDVQILKTILKVIYERYIACSSICDGFFRFGEYCKSKNKTPIMYKKHEKQKFQRQTESQQMNWSMIEFGLFVVKLCLIKLDIFKAFSHISI